MAERQAIILSNILNASTAAALLQMHSAVKTALLSSMNKVLDDSGKAVLVQFKEGTSH